MSHAEQFDWLISLLKSAAEANGTSLARERMAFIAEQEALCSSQQARPEKDCRAQAREAVYEVVRHFTPTAYEVDAPWPADGKEYAKLRVCIGPLYLRAMLSKVPLGELKVITEVQRRKGSTAHTQVKTPPYQMRDLLGECAKVLGVPITSGCCCPPPSRPHASPQPMGCSWASAATRAMGRVTSGCAGTTVCVPKSAPTRRSGSTPSGSAGSSRSHKS